jgi:hypothetical protein
VLVDCKERSTSWKTKSVVPEKIEGQEKTDGSSRTLITEGLSVEAARIEDLAKTGAEHKSNSCLPPVS